jgi:hypothetical protein
VGDEKGRLLRQAKDNDRTVAAEAHQLRRDLATKRSMLDKYIHVTKEQVGVPCANLVVTSLRELWVD